MKTAQMKTALWDLTTTVFDALRQFLTSLVT
jgi:hypothetical protein